jgi:hypothetical protein
MVTLNEQDAVAPPVLFAVHVIEFVVPRGKTEPDAGEQLTDAIPSESVALGLKSTCADGTPVVGETIILPGQATYTNDEQISEDQKSRDCTYCGRWCLADGDSEDATRCLCTTRQVRGQGQLGDISLTLFALSLATQLTLRVPISKADPEGGEQSIDWMPLASLALAWKVATVPFNDVGSKLMGRGHSVNGT